MLYNPNWSKPSLAGLIAWLETQSAEHSYHYMDCDGMCLFGQYMASLGIKWRADPAGGLITPYWHTLKAVGGFEAQTIAANAPHTFGAALDRARKFAASAE
jgi:hypothetical protein